MSAKPTHAVELGLVGVAGPAGRLEGAAQGAGRVAHGVDPYARVACTVEFPPCLNEGLDVHAQEAPKVRDEEDAGIGVGWGIGLGL